MTTVSDAASTSWLALRSLIWTLLFPGMIAGYLPWRYFGLRDAHVDLSDPLQLLGLLSMVLGAALLAACIVEFARSGRGTLSPVDPPRHLVVRGLYRYVRNPMYVSVTAIILGEFLLLRTPALAVYWAAWFAAVNLFVIGYEEPYLRHRFGASYRRLHQAGGPVDSAPSPAVHAWMKRTDHGPMCPSRGDRAAAPGPMV